MNPDVPADLFTACLTTPIEVAFRWYVCVLVNGMEEEEEETMVWVLWFHDGHPLFLLYFAV